MYHSCIFPFQITHGPELQKEIKHTPAPRPLADIRADQEADAVKNKTKNDNNANNDTNNEDSTTSGNKESYEKYERDKDSKPPRGSTPDESPSAAQFIGNRENTTIKPTEADMLKQNALEIMEDIGEEQSEDVVTGITENTSKVEE